MMPLDIEPNEKGNLVIRQGIAHHVNREIDCEKCDGQWEPSGDPCPTCGGSGKVPNPEVDKRQLRMSHFASCPGAARHRKKGTSA